MVGQRALERKRRLAQTLIGLWAKELDRASMLAAAIVFSPHQDDETLGCGGTIYRKRQLGASVHVVFVTDGTSSPPTVPVQERKAMREREARAACQQLGVSPESVTFLGFEDGRLLEETDGAIGQVTAFLAGHSAQQIFVPYYQDRDPSLDHIATNQIVAAALRQLDRRAVVHEYPVWFWRFWPRTRVPVRGRRGVWETQPRSVPRNLRALVNFNSCVDVGDVLDRKQMALDQHRSQLEELYSIQSSAFVKWFLSRREVFYRHRLP